MHARTEANRIALREVGLGYEEKILQSLYVAIAH